MPLLRDGEVLGELDIDSHELGAFSGADESFLAGVCAIAVGLF